MLSPCTVVQQPDWQGPGREVQATGLLSQDETPDLDQAAREQHDGTLYSLVPDNERRVLRAPGISTKALMEVIPCIIRAKQLL